MAFQNDRLPDLVEIGAQYRHRYNTMVFTADSGHEQRNILWNQSRGAGDVGFPFAGKTDTIAGRTPMETIISHFRTKYGRAHTFPLKDWSDFDIGDQDDPAATRQTIGTGDDVTVDFQIFKRYSSGAANYDRTVYLIVSGTLFVYIDGALQTESADYTVNYLTGVITFSSAPAGGSVPEVIAVTTQFYNHIRYGIDSLNTAMEDALHGRIPNIPIIEVRGPGS